MGSSLTEPSGQTPGQPALHDGAAQPGPTVESLAATAAPAALEHLPPGMRIWFGAFLLWMGGLAVLALTMLHRYEADGDQRAMGIFLLAWMCFYLSLCNAFVPLPTTWVILAAASPGSGLTESDWLRIAAVSVVGALATVAANLNEYHVLAFLCHRGLGRRIRGTRLYQWSIHWFDVAPFQMLLAMGFFPLPVDAIRWLAILRRYSRVRFGLAYFLGRGARYVIFAAAATLMRFSSWQIAAIQVGIILLALVARVVGPPIVRRLVRRKPQNP
jgi:membrane protein YqaA with SNARE-associated domain